MRRRDAYKIAIGISIIAAGFLFSEPLLGADYTLPTTEVNIPGPHVTFFGPITETTGPECKVFATKDTPNPTCEVIPWIGDYIIAWYRWLVGIVGVIAVVLIMWGGVKWISAGGSSERISSAKETIISALIGLFLLVGSYVFLNAINPELTALHGIVVPGIQYIEFPKQALTLENAQNLKTATEQLTHSAAFSIALNATCDRTNHIRDNQATQPQKPTLMFVCKDNQGDYKYSGMTGNVNASDSCSPNNLQTLEIFGSLTDLKNNATTQCRTLDNVDKFFLWFWVNRTVADTTEIAGFWTLDQLEQPIVKSCSVVNPGDNEIQMGGLTQSFCH